MIGTLQAVSVFAPFTEPLLWSAFATLLLLALLSGSVGVVAQLQRLEFLTDAISHAVLPGLAFGALAAGDPGLLPGALAAAGAMALALPLLQRAGVRSESAIAILLAALFAIGVVVIAHANISQNLTGLLFGRILAIPTGQLVTTAVLTLIAAALVAVTWRAQVSLAFDPQWVRAARLHPGALAAIAHVAVAIAVVAAASAVGVLLVLAVLLVPAAAARLLTDRIRLLPIMSALFAAVAAWLGLALSWGLSVDAGLRAAPSAVVALTFVALYVACLGIYGLRRAGGRA